MKLLSTYGLVALGAGGVLWGSLTAFAVSDPEPAKSIVKSNIAAKAAKASAITRAKASAKAKAIATATESANAKASQPAPMPLPTAAHAALAVPAPHPKLVIAGRIPLPAANPQRPEGEAGQAGLDPPPPLPQRAPRPSKYAAALAPLLDYSLSDSDRANLRKAINAGYRKDFADAMAAKTKIRDAGARKLAIWYAYRSGAKGASGIAIEQFRRGNPLWPDQEKLRQNAEESLFLNPLEAEQVIAFFEESEPETGAGKAALAHALLEKGHKSRAQALVVSAWRDHDFGEEIESEILERFAQLLSEEDHKVRIDRLLYADKSSKTGAALRIAKLLGENEQKKVEARVAVVRRSAKAGKMLEALPDEQIKADVGLFFNKIQWLRRSDREIEAWEAMLDAPNEPEQLVDVNEWWIERRIHCRTALNQGQPFVAYEIAANHGPLTGYLYRDAEFMAGWIALRFLGRTDDALAHFLALRTASDDPKWISTAAYWLGRTAEAMGNEEAAKRHFAEAAQHAQHYYGQLAAQKIGGGGAVSLEIAPTPEPSAADIKRFLALDAVKATALLREAGLDNLVPHFLFQLARSVKKPAHAVLTAELGLLYKQRQATVRLAKIAFNRGMPVAEYAFPTNVLPPFEKLNEGVELALIHALTRQESEFNVDARSPAGARGLMQFMPATARGVARKYDLPYSLSKLYDASYNVALGSAHLRDLVDEFNGSYILTLVAYNAGPGRSRDWSELYGSPMHPHNDPVDWVERIPFYETRNYVKKIMESLQIYRALLQGPQRALKLKQDLNRGRPRTASETASAN